MSRPEPKVGKRCSSCGAALNRKARFCRQCGAEITKYDTIPLDTVKIEETQGLDIGVMKEVESKETRDTVALETQQIISTDEIEEAETPSGNDAAVETQSADAASVWAIEKDEDENEAVAWTETSPTVALSSETVPLIETIEKAEHETEILTEDANEELPNNKTLEVKTENFDDESKLTVKEKSNVFTGPERRSHSRVKRMVVKSQKVLNRTSDDMGLRFAIISIVVFLLALGLFFFSRYLK